MSEFVNVSHLPVWGKSKQLLLDLRKIAVNLRDHTIQIKEGLERLRDDEIAAVAHPQRPSTAVAEEAGAVPRPSSVEGSNRR